MIVLPSRALTRLVALVLLPVLGLVAGAFAFASIAGGETSRSVASAAGLIGLWDDVGTFLSDTAPAGGTTVVVSAIGGLVVGIVLLIGALAPARERELTLPGEKALAVRRRALRRAIAAEAGHARGTTATKVRLRTRRLRHGGRLRVRATRSPRAERAPIKQALSERVAPLGRAFSLRTSVSTRVGRSRKSRIA